MVNRAAILTRPFHPWILRLQPRRTKHRDGQVQVCASCRIVRRSAQGETVTKYPPHVVSDRRARKLGAIWLARVGVDSHWGSGPVWRAHDVRAEDEETIWIERFSSAHKGSPPRSYSASARHGMNPDDSPIFDVCTTSEGVADDHNVVSALVERTPGFVRDRHVA